MCAWHPAAGGVPRCDRVALLTLLFFGCATSRPPSMLSLPLAGPAPQRVALAEPELELWLEGSHRVDPAEAARALDRGARRSRTRSRVAGSTASTRRTRSSWSASAR